MSNSFDGEVVGAALDGIAPEEREPAFDPGPGHLLMSRADLDAAVGGVDNGGDWEDGGASSREEAVRRRELARYRDDPELLWRKHVVADDALVGRLARVARDAPNLARAVEVVRRAAVLSRHGRAPIRVPPVVLLGPPGAGKTRYASLLGQALGVQSTRIDGASVKDVGKLTGYHPSWRGAGPGLVAKALLGCTSTSPVVVIDEAEKIEAIDSPPCPLDALLPALETITAERYRDGYYEVPMRAEGIIWILCVNDLAGLSAPLLDRCVVVDVPALSGAERHRVLDDVAADVALEHCIGPAPLDPACLAVLDEVGLRGARNVYASALAGALDEGRDVVTAADLRAAAALLGVGRRPRRPRAGFIAFEHD